MGAEEWRLITLTAGLSRTILLASAVLAGFRGAVGADATPPVVTGCAGPASGSTLGFALTAVGEGFPPGATLLWNGSLLATVGSNATTLSASVPSGFAFSADGARISAFSNGVMADCFLVNLAPPPSVVRVQPNQIDTGGQAFQVVVSGGNFGQDSVVNWAGIPLPSGFEGPGLLTAWVPASAVAVSGRYDIAVVNSGAGSSNPVPFFVQPVLAGITPETAAAGSPDTTIAASGAGFVPTDVLVLDDARGSLKLPTAYAGPTVLTAVVPAAELAAAFHGSLSVLDRDPQSGAFSRALPFTVGGALILNSLAPSAATAGGPGFTLTAGGGGFVPGSVLQWNGSGLPTIFVGATRLTGYVAAGLVADAGTAAIAVVNPNGIASDISPFAIQPAAADSPAPYAGTEGIVNAASSLPSLAPGALISIFGSDLASETGAATGTPLPTAILGASITINGDPAPLLWVSATQINAQVPFETPPGIATLVVTVNAVRSAPAVFEVAAAGPGVFADPDNHAVAANYPDGTLNSPENPARPGQYVVVYLTGQGLVDNPLETGAAATAPPPSAAIAPVEAWLGGQPAMVDFLGLAPGYVGVAQMNLVVPNVGPGEQFLQLTVGGRAANPTTLSIRSN
jgi:uncharacterized protein (TIGR03437 family)